MHANAKVHCAPRLEQPKLVESSVHCSANAVARHRQYSPLQIVIIVYLQK